jgi:hypothetical protein
MTCAFWHCFVPGAEQRLRRLRDSAPIAEWILAKRKIPNVHVEICAQPQFKEDRSDAFENYNHELE